MKLLVRHPFALASTFPIAAEAAIRAILSEPQRSEPGSDPELLWWELRGNWILEAVEQTPREECVNRFDRALCQAQDYPADTYSASQRIANAVYLIRSHPVEERSAVGRHMLQHLLRDIVAVRDRPEMRPLTRRFNNHLLNNYRAAVMLEASRDWLPGAPSMSGVIDAMVPVLERHFRRLFSADGVLLEGSVSYELLGFKHLVDISCCRPVDAFGARSIGWLSPQVERVRRTFYKSGKWLLPQIGDCSPDWNPGMIVLFLNGVVLGHETSYRRIWREELSAIGL